MHGLNAIGSEISIGVTGRDVFPSSKLVKAAHEFEAAMMKELVAPMLPGKDGAEADDSGSALTSFAGEALGQAISEHGGFGIAKSILEQLSPTQKDLTLSKGNFSGSATVPKAERKSDLNRTLP